ncbi:MAG: hypothetical protein KDD12_01335 [Lewinella sp.]|nr:hypothetical protein [Lewinella sp.]
MITRLLKPFALLASMALLWPPSSFSRTPADAFPRQQSFFDFLSGVPVREITIEADFSQFLENKNTDNYQPAVVTFDDNGGAAVTFDAKIRSRGKYRRRVCDLPPIKLNLPKGRLKDLGLREDFDKYKIVTHCLDERDPGQDNVVKELMAYQLYNQLTPYSFRTQLLRVQYIDTSGKMGRFKRLAILIEDNDELADRMNLTKCEDCLNPDPLRVNPQLEMTHALFQFMIGNADFSMKMARNIEMFLNEKGEIVPVPFDFDFAGLVNAGYAIANTDYGLTSVRDRIYLGIDRPNSELLPVIRQFKTKEPEFLAIVMQNKNLDRESRVDVADFLDTFYTEIDGLLSRPQGDWAAILTRKQMPQVRDSTINSGK